MEVRCMKLRIPSLFLLTLLFLDASSIFSPGDPGCRLNFSTYPYKPTGGCSNAQESLKDWNIFPKTSCCQNALIAFSHALAIQAKLTPTGYIFVGRDELNDCSGPFRVQPNISITSCGFDHFYYGRGSSTCSKLKLENINQKVTDQCSSSFDYYRLDSSFDYACGDCINAITETLKNITVDFDKDYTERATCLVALIVSVMDGVNYTLYGDDFERCLPALSVPKPEDYIKIDNTLAAALIAMILAIVGLTLIITLIKYVTKNQKQGKIKSEHSKEIIDTPGLYRFSRVEIENAINYGTEKKCLGRGSAGLVYKGMLPSGQLVAIKKIFKSNTLDSFSREIAGLSRVRHPNLVCLFGCCIEDGEQYLVYEYCHNGNLSQHLLRKDTVLTWEMRVKILRDCAFALKYLHTHINGCIVHRDIKLTNILLTHEMEPKLSDFGLAKMLGMEESKVFTDVRGTIGYMDPEYMSNAKLTSASDIYSFGIVTLQLLSGQRVIELDLDARDQLTRKAKDVNMGKRPLKDFQDPRMKGNIVTVDFESILQIAVLCVASSSTGRPTIDLVLEELEKAWKNTQLEMRARKEKNLLVTSSSKSQVW